MTNPHNVPSAAASVNPAPATRGDICARCRDSGTGRSTTAEHDAALIIRRVREARVREMTAPAWVAPCRRLGYSGCRNVRTINRPPTIDDLDCGQHDIRKENVA